eukprot:390504-Prymnesium_polylepis.2
MALRGTRADTLGCAQNQEVRTHRQADASRAGFGHRSIETETCFNAPAGGLTSGVAPFTGRPWLARCAVGRSVRWRHDHIRECAAPAGSGLRLQFRPTPLREPDRYGGSVLLAS